MKMLLRNRPRSFWRRHWFTQATNPALLPT
ncbi:hypothetical protein QTG54_011272 [Skeletonema marinoi]|uniref:Uncharacterized protein n=1 Tax=Skeletonema marinoi TaxID=267567 RepID=A0AAD8Y1V3_9STRA|nr:hypothetical protein QTG54_011272 [Skeletonema marinoi]